MKQVAYNNELQKLQMMAVRDAESQKLTSAETLIKLSELKKQIKQMNDVTQAEVKEVSKRIPQIQYSDINLPSPRSETYTPKPYSPVVESPYSYYSPAKKYTPPSNKQLPSNVLDQLRVKLDERNSRNSSLAGSPTSSTGKTAPIPDEEEKPELPYTDEEQAQIAQEYTAPANFDETKPPANPLYEETERKGVFLTNSNATRWFNKKKYIEEGEDENDKANRDNEVSKLGQDAMKEAFIKLSKIIKEKEKDAKVTLFIGKTLQTVPIKLSENKKNIEFFAKPGGANTTEKWQEISSDKLFKTIQKVKSDTLWT